MADDVKGYVVRGNGPAGPVHGCRLGYDLDDRPAPILTMIAAMGACATLVNAGFADVSILRVHDDGREERLPSYEEALAEIQRLQGLIGAFAKRARLKSDADGWCNLVAEFPAFDALRQERDGSAPTDRLAALEAAEQRMLEAGGWTYVGLHGGEQWQHAKHGREGRMTALSMARQSAAKKGGS